MPGIVENIRNTLEGGVSQVTGSDRQGGAYPKDLSWDALKVASSIDVDAGKFNKIGEFTVPAGQAYAWGYGSQNNPENQGWIYFNPQNSTPEEIDGIVRLLVENPNDIVHKKGIAMERRTETLDRKDDNSGKPETPLPRQGRRVGEDNKLSIYLKPDSNDTVDDANTTLEAPVTAWLQGT